MTHPKAPGFSLGITDTMIRGLVDAFYARVRDDAVLGPIFEAKIHDWEEHLAKLTDFWSSIVLMSGRYKGRPMPVHAAIPEISGEHFVRWLKLFGDTAEEVCPPQAALLFKDRAMRIAESLKAGVAIQRREAAASP